MNWLGVKKKKKNHNNNTEKKEREIRRCPVSRVNYSKVQSVDSFVGIFIDYLSAVISLSLLYFLYFLGLVPMKPQEKNVKYLEGESEFCMWVD